MSKGLACERRRLMPDDGGWPALLECSRTVRVALLVGMASALGMLCLWGGGAWPEWAEMLTRVGLLLVAALVWLWLRFPEVWSRCSRLALLGGAVLMQVAVVRAIEVQVPAGQPIQHWIPTVFAPMVVSVLLGAGPGVYAAVTAGLVSSVMVRGGAAMLPVTLLSGLVAVAFSHDLRRRSQLLRAGVYAGLIAFAGTLAQAAGPGVTVAQLLPNAALAGGVGLATALAVGALLPLLEGVFRITTGISWLELADLNHPLLRRLTMEAPGTYHHSLMVAQLAEAAAQCIGANALQCRVSAYFHDVGKIEKAEYFTENQAFRGNPHDALAPTMSALVVMSHVKEGVSLAMAHRLNEAVLSAIREHHGTTRVSYFHARALQQERDAREGGRLMHLREEDIPRVSEETFRYPGPKPQTKETAVLMLADACEGASRSLDRPTPQDIEEMVKGILHDRIEDGQFDECPISLRELHAVGDRLASTLTSMLHSRVAYPKEESDERETGARDRVGEPAGPAPASRPEAPRAA